MWAEETLGAKIGRRMGQERIELANGASWRCVAQKSALGHSANLLVVDEAHSVAERAYADGLVPPLAAADSALTVATSTAHADTSPVMPRLRQQAARPGRVFLAEWSAAPDADLADIDTFRRLSPVWNKTRHNLIEQAIGSDAAVTEWANRWPGEPSVQAAVQWPPGWSQCPRVDGPPPGGGVAVIETSDRQSWGVALAVTNGDAVSLWTVVVDSAGAAAALTTRWGADRVLVGASVLGAVAQHNPACEPFVSTMVRSAVPALVTAVKVGSLRHSHDDATTAQTFRVAIVATDSGTTISTKRSTGPVAAIKAAALAVQQAVDVVPEVRPAIW